MLARRPFQSTLSIPIFPLIASQSGMPASKDLEYTSVSPFLSSKYKPSNCMSPSKVIKSFSISTLVFVLLDT